MRRVMMSSTVRALRWIAMIRASALDSSVRAAAATTGAATTAAWTAVGSEEARLQRWPPSAAQTGRAVFPHPAFTKARHQREVAREGIREIKSHKSHLAVELTLREPFPAPTPPPLESMRPDPSHDPAVETGEELADVGLADNTGPIRE